MVVFLGGFFFFLKDYQEISFSNKDLSRYTYGATCSYSENQFSWETSLFTDLFSFTTLYDNTEARRSTEAEPA